MSRSVLAWKRPAPELSSGNGPCSFPNSPRAWWQKFNLINQKHREHVRDVIMPAAIANKEAILKSPREIDRIIAEHLKATAATVQKEAAEKKVVAAIKALPAREREVIFYGERMWPVVNPTYDFDQLCAAIWSFQDLNRWLLQTPDNSVGSRGRIIRFTTKWMQEYINRMVPSEAGSRIKKIYRHRRVRLRCRRSALARLRLLEASLVSRSFGALRFHHFATAWHASAILRLNLSRHSRLPLRAGRKSKRNFRIRPETQK
jgi:hypothetical protein